MVFKSSTFSSLPSGIQWFGKITEKLLFLSVILKTEFVVSKKVIANSRFLFSARFIGGVFEKVSICLFSFK